MKLKFFNRPAQEQAQFIKEAAARRGLPTVMVEKDFWVSWILSVLFGHPEFSKELVFKGGTSLSKVFGVIDRFSEDIDLSVSPEFLGITEASIEQHASKKKMQEQIKGLELACISRVSEHFVSELERAAEEVLGKASGHPWMEFQVDAATHSPVVLFHYPSIVPSGFAYLGRSVKMEFGSLTDQRPTSSHSIKPWVAEEFVEHFADYSCELIALELERTFWEKATILHAEYHRDASKPIRDRFSRHYFDMAALALHSIRDRALACADLRQRVVDWKARFFSSGWARYDLAKPGTFRLPPPQYRVAELSKDYEAMQVMFLKKPPAFENLLKVLSDLELCINQGL